MRLPEVFGCTTTVAFRYKSLNDDRAIYPGVEEKGCKYTTATDKNESYYTRTITASKLHDLLSSHHKADGKGIHMLGGDLS